jgi:hypothetical protein
MLLERVIDSGRTQYTVQYHCGAAVYAGLVPVGGWRYVKFAGCQSVTVNGLLGKLGGGQLRASVRARSVWCGSTSMAEQVVHTPMTWKP